MRGKTIAALFCLALAVSGTGCAAKNRKAAKQAADVLTAETALVEVDAAMAHHQLRKAKTLLQKV